MRNKIIALAAALALGTAAMTGSALAFGHGGGVAADMVVALAAVILAVALVADISAAALPARILRLAASPGAGSL